MKNILFLTFLFMVFISCKKDENLPAPYIPVNEDSDGYSLLLIGNSFFRPYAEKLDVLADEAGFIKHNSVRITRGGDNGRPINFWNDSLTQEHLEIKATLDNGDVEIFGMTAGHDTINRIEGHRKWIKYARQNNPNIKIFIAIPQIDFPADWEERAEEYGFSTIQELYDYFVNDIVHNEMVDELRDRVPSNKNLHYSHRLGIS